MEVLITGGGGFFGKALVRAFARAGHDVLAADLGSPEEFKPRPGTPSARYVKLDVSNAAAWDNKAFGGVGGVIHAAALTPTMDQMHSNPWPLVSVNLIGTLNALEFARKNKCEKFLFVSSAGVYDQFTERVLDESDADGGFSLYGSGKLAAEIMLWRYGRMYNIDAGAIRPTSMYGPAEQMRETRPFVTQVKSLVDAALAGRPVRLQGLEARCDWIYVDDVAEAAAVFFGGAMEGRVFSLSSGRPTPFREVVEAVQAAVPLTVDPDAKEIVDGSPDRPTVISNQRLRTELGWAPPNDLKTGVRAYVEEIRSNVRRSGVRAT